MLKSYLRSGKPIIDPKLKFKYYQALKAKKKVEVLEETGPIPEKKDYGDKVSSHDPTVVKMFTLSLG